jgi:hypothetical protein
LLHGEQAKIEGMRFEDVELTCDNRALYAAVKANNIWCTPSRCGSWRFAPSWESCPVHTRHIVFVFYGGSTMSQAKSRVCIFRLGELTLGELT